MTITFMTFTEFQLSLGFCVGPLPLSEVTICAHGGRTKFHSMLGAVCPFWRSAWRSAATGICLGVYLDQSLKVLSIHEHGVSHCYRISPA